MDKGESAAAQVTEGREAEDRGATPEPCLSGTYV
jgi:hypothetical protein